MNLGRALQHVRDSARQYGAGAALHELQYLAVNRVVPFQILKGMTVVVDDIEPSMFEAAGYQIRFASREEVLRAIADPEVAEEMSVEFARAALDRCDECYAVFDGDRMVSFGWYSSRPTPVADDVLLRFDPSWVYMYKGYTLRDFRGQRLHGIGMSHAARDLTARGARGLISYVKSNNFPSLRSIERMGYRVFGEVFLARPFGRPLSWASPGCRAYGFRLEARHTAAHLS
ncbi:MAG TPA: GNAT family N-acetyltransferase [Kofleriaceae bacterium]|nr:GNAT family N-acetyltransferase [Kofleriaceae bacterium]